jgi:hypothetical protein
MHIVYLDESGDLGSTSSPTRFFILSGILFAHEHWIVARRSLEGMRANLQSLYSLNPDIEIHAAEFLGGAVRHNGLDIRRRFQCAHHVLNFLLKSDCLRPVRFGVEKSGEGGRALLDIAWAGLAAEIACELRKAPESACGSRGILVVMDHHGASPYRPEPRQDGAVEQPLLELPFGRRSEDSDFLQVADLLGFLTKQKLDPNRHFSGSQGRSLLRLSEQLYSSPCRIIR